MKALKPFLLLGSTVVIFLGYQESMEEVFRGVITQVQFISETQMIPCVEVNVMDVKGIMMANCYARQMRADHYSKAVREIFEKNVYQNLISQGAIQKLAISNTPDTSNGQPREISQTIEMVSESDYEFVVKAAKKLNYEFFIQKGTLYFRKSKDTQGTLIELSPKQGLMESRISYDLCGIVSFVEARGMDTGKGEAVRAKKKFNHKISQGNKAKPLLSQTGRVYLDPSIHTKEQAEQRAQSLLEDMAYRFGAIEGTCVGMPELLPGNFLNITGLGAPADNRFYLEKIRHVLTEQTGYQTHFLARAPGLEKG